MPLVLKERKLLLLLCIAVLGCSLLRLVMEAYLVHYADDEAHKNDEAMIKGATAISSSSLLFPKYGTMEFANKCPWTLSSKTSEKKSCTILARPSPTSGEGLSNWICQVVAGHIMALQAQCNLLLDYGTQVDISQVLVPQQGGLDWRVPPEFECIERDHCFLAHESYGHEKLKSVQKLLQRPDLLPVPSVRSAFKSSVDPAITPYHELIKFLPNFNLTTAAACSLGSLFSLQEFRDEEYKLLWRQLEQHVLNRDTILALYIRTGQTEDLSKDLTPDFDKQVTPIIDCALELEEEQQRELQRQGTDDSPNFVWLIITDSQHVKRWVVDYMNKKKNHPTTTTVLVTPSRGAHTKPRLGPSTDDFVQALLDWYLMGEFSSLVIGSGPTFGDTAALRTNRPYYKNGCQLQKVFPPGHVNLDFLANMFAKKKGIIKNASKDL